MTAARKRRLAFDIPLDSSSWWPLGMSLDEWRAARVLSAEQPTYHTPEREAAARVFAERAGLKNYRLEHEPEGDT